MSDIYQGNSDNNQSHEDYGFHSRLMTILEGEKNSTAFARKAGISQSGLHRLQKGGEPTLKTIIAIANAAGVSVQWLATGEGDREHKPKSVRLDTQEASLLKSIRAMGSSRAPLDSNAPTLSATDSDHLDIPPIDGGLLSRAIDGVQQVYKKEGGHIQTISAVQLGLEIHNRIFALVEGDEARRGALIMVLDQLTKDLRSAAQTSNDGDKRTA